MLILLFHLIAEAVEDNSFVSRVLVDKNKPIVKLNNYVAVIRFPENKVVGNALILGGIGAFFRRILFIGRLFRGSGLSVRG